MDTGLQTLPSPGQVGVIVHTVSIGKETMIKLRTACLSENIAGRVSVSHTVVFACALQRCVHEYVYA